MGTLLLKQYHTTWIYIGGYILRKNVLIYRWIYRGKGFYIRKYKKMELKINEKI